jgi:ERCC4-type nuclease
MERKSIRDLIASAADGRIARFWQGAVEEAIDGAEQLNVLLLEGDQFRATGYGDSSWDASRLDNLLLSLQMAGVLVVHTRSSDDCAERIAALWKYTGKPDRGESLRRVIGPETEGSYLNPVRRSAVRSLMGIPGWGEARAAAAIGVFGSPALVLQALLARDYKAFAGVHGVGKGLVDGAAEFLLRRVD